MDIQEVWLPKRVAANIALFGKTTPNGAISGFLCTTAGNIGIQDADGNSIVDPCAVVQGQFLNFPCACPNGATVIVSGGCVGTVFYMA
jgi:hypothetical protein